MTALRQSWLILVRQKRFLAGCLMLLAFGIGTSVGILELLRRVLWAPLPFGDAASLTVIAGTSKETGSRIFELTPTQARTVLSAQKSIGEIGGYVDPRTLPGGMSLSEAHQTLHVIGAVVSANFFTLLGRSALLGRTFVLGEDEPGASQVVVLSYDFWRGQFGGDAGVIGRLVEINERPYRVIGVMPERLRFPAGVDLWVPGWLRSDLVTNMPTAVQSDVYLLARLHAGVSNREMLVRLDSMARELQASDPYESEGLRLIATPIRDFLVNPERQSALLLAISAVAILLLACFNVTNLFLIRANARLQEVGVRAALGAEIADLRIQMLCEGLIAGLLGALPGIAIALIVLRAGSAFLHGLDIPDSGPAGVHFFAEAIALSLLAGLLCGVGPAIGVSQAWVESALREGDRSVRTGGGRRRLQQWMAAGQTGLSLILAFTACLTIITLRNLTSVSWGFSANSVWFAPLTVHGSHDIDANHRREIFRRIVDAAKQIPGVQGAALTTGMPTMETNLDAIYDIEGAPQDTPVQVARAAVSPDYFRTMGVPLIAGRDFNSTDVMGGPCVIVVDRQLAQRLWPGKSPVGLHLYHRRDLCEIVGVAGSIRTSLLATQRRPLIYTPLDQDRSDISHVLILRPSAPGIDLSKSVAAFTKTLPPAVDLERPVRFSDKVYAAISDSRMREEICAWFAALALMLAAVGIFANTLFTVNRRWHELAVRIVVGARPTQVYRLAIGESVRLVAIGLAAGLAFCPLLYKSLSSLFFGINSWQSLPLMVGIVASLTVSTCAGHLAAYRAIRLDPVVALRQQ